MVETKLKTKSALSYFGSDSEVAARLASRLDGCKHVTIPFVGGASILPHLTARAIICNDLNALAINFYRVISGSHGSKLKAALIERCKLTLSHPDELEAAQYYIDQDPSFAPELRAWAYWAVCWVGRKGKGAKKKKIALHRLVWMFANKRLVPEGFDVDHIKGKDIAYPDAITNLRLLESSRNRSRGKPYAGTTEELPF